MGNKKTLVILSHGFGTNFSGGTSATHFIFLPLRHKFQEVVFIGKEVGEHEFGQLTFKRYRSIYHAVSMIKALNKSRDAIFYGDFYMTYFYRLAGVPYYFTYHDNWPEQANQSLRDKFQGIFYTPLYRWIIKHSSWTFAVSHFKLRFIKGLTDRCSLVRNGVVTTVSPSSNKKSGIRALMMGNIDSRKYEWALALFRLMDKEEVVQITIDIYGRGEESRLAKRLNAFNFVRLKGFHSGVPLNEYDVLLSTSKMENLSISVVEALKGHLPVIAFDVGGLSEVVNKSNGRLILPGDVRTMLKEIMELPEKEFTFMDNDLEEFDWEVAAGKYEEIILADQ